MGSTCACIHHHPFSLSLSLMQTNNKPFFFRPSSAFSSPSSNQQHQFSFSFPLHPTTLPPTQQSSSLFRAIHHHQASSQLPSSFRQTMPCNHHHIHPFFSCHCKNKTNENKNIISIIHPSILIIIIFFLSLSRNHSSHHRTLIVTRKKTEEETFLLPLLSCSMCMGQAEGQAREGSNEEKRERQHSQYQEHHPSSFSIPSILPNKLEAGRKRKKRGGRKKEKRKKEREAPIFSFFSSSPSSSSFDERTNVWNFGIELS